MAVVRKFRRVGHRRDRRLTRWATRMAHGVRRPDPLAPALRACGAVVRCTRRLMRLAPTLFDRAIFEREERVFAAEAARHRELVAVISKVYAVPVDEVPLASPSKNRFWCKKGEEKVKYWENVWSDFKPRERAAIDHELEHYDACLALSREALNRYRRL